MAEFPFIKPDEEVGDDVVIEDDEEVGDDVVIEDDEEVDDDVVIEDDEEVDDDNIVIEDDNVEEETTKKKKTAVRKTKKEIEPSDIQFVIKNVKSKSYQDMADELNLTKSQINRILMDIKKTLRENTKGDEVKEKKVEKYITENLTRSGEKRTGKVREAIKNIVDEITSKLY